MAETNSQKLQRKYYSEKELRDMRRVDIRTIASEWYGMDPKVCSKKSTADVVTYVIEKQEEEYGKDGSGNGKGKVLSMPATKGRALRRTTKAQAQEPEKVEEPEIMEGDLGTKVDALGQAIDNNFQSIAQLEKKIDELGEALRKDVFFIMGLCHGLYMANEGEDGLNERLSELEEMWEAEGNG